MGPGVLTHPRVIRQILGASTAVAREPGANGSPPEGGTAWTGDGSDLDWSLSL